MASVEINDRKRVQMSSHIIRLRNLGWTNTQLAVWMGVSPGTVAQWWRAKSMGTNAQRGELAKLGSPAEERLSILHIAESLEREALTSENLLEEEAARFPDRTPDRAKLRRERIASIRARAEALRKLFA